MKKIKEKIKKYSFWTGLASASVMLLTTISKAFGLSINNQIAEDVIMSICGVLTALGIVCVPKQKKEDKDFANNKQKDNKVNDKNIDFKKEPNNKNEIPNINNNKNIDNTKKNNE